MSDIGAAPPLTGKYRSLFFLMLAEIAGMSLWFMSAAILPDMVADYPISDFRQAALSSAVQIAASSRARSSPPFSVCRTGSIHVGPSRLLP